MREAVMKYSLILCLVIATTSNSLFTKPTELHEALLGFDYAEAKKIIFNLQECFGPSESSEIKKIEIERVRRYVDQKNEEELTVLHQLASFQIRDDKSIMNDDLLVYQELIPQLKKLGADLNLRDPDGNSPALIAIQQFGASSFSVKHMGDVTTTLASFVLLLRSFLKVDTLGSLDISLCNATNNEHKTILHYIVEHPNSYLILRLLLKNVDYKLFSINLNQAAIYHLYNRTRQYAEHFGQEVCEQIFRMCNISDHIEDCLQECLQIDAALSIALLHAYMIDDIDKGGASSSRQYLEKPLGERFEI